MEDPEDPYVTTAAFIDEPRPEPPEDRWGRARRELAEEVLARFGELPRQARLDFVAPPLPIDYRYGPDNKLAVAMYSLQSRHGRRPPRSGELGESHVADAHVALRQGVRAITVGDLLCAEEFALLTAPLAALVGLDIAARHASLRPEGTPAAAPIVTPRPDPVDPLPDHELWLHTRDRLVDVMRGFGEPDVYVVDLQLDFGWVDDVRQAGVEIRWSTDRDLAERRRAWDPDPELLRYDPLAAEQVPWEYWGLREAGAGQTLWNRESDPAGHALVEGYGRAVGLWYSDEELEEPEDEDALVDNMLELASCLEAGLVHVVHELHRDGTIAATFGRPIPVTFSSWDSHAAAWRLGRAANPPELYARFGPAQERSWSPG